MKKLEYFFKNFQQKQRIIVSFSGGADSTYLLYKAKQYEKLFKYQVHAIYFNHNLREDSQQEQKFCQELCKKWQIPLNITQLNFKNEQSIEEQARIARRQSYQEIYSDEIILLAHHYDDFEENFFLRLIRGANLTSLVSLQEYHFEKNVHYYRPLLSINKQGILTELEKLQITFYQDKSNFQSKYSRNFIRNEILTKLKAHFNPQGIRQSLELLKGNAQYIKEKIHEILSQIPFPQKKDFIKIPSIFHAELLQTWWEKQQNNYLPMTQQFLIRFQKHINDCNPKDKNNLIPIEKKRHILLTTQGEIIPYEESTIPTEIDLSTIDWTKENKYRFNSYNLIISQTKPPKKFNIDSEAFCLDFLESCEQISFTHKLTKQSLIPFARKTEKKISDLFSNKKIPSPLRKYFPIFSNSHNNLWIPHIKRSKFGKVENKDKLVYLSIEIQHPSIKYLLQSRKLRNISK